MVEQKMELRKVRDFGANISDTFEFIRQNFKPIVRSFFAIAGIFILLQAISSGVFESRVFFNLKQISASGSGNIFENRGIVLARYLSFPYFVFIMLTWLAYTAMQVCIGAYMKYYEQNDKQQPGIEEVWNIFKAYYLKVLVYSIPVTILVMVGVLLCVVPGILLGVVFVPFPWVIMMEDASLGDGIQRCFDLIKENFWMSLGIYLVAYIIYAFSSGVIGLFIGLISGLLSHVTATDFTTTIGIITSILRVFGFLFYIIFLVSAMLNYFNLAEQRDATGILKRVDQIGSQPNEGNLPNEQY